MLFKVSHGREILVSPQPWSCPGQPIGRGAGNHALQGAGSHTSLLVLHFFQRRLLLTRLYLQLSFIGVTVTREQKYVHFTSTSHQFIPVSIGDTLPPRQVSGLHHPGHQEASLLTFVYLHQSLIG